MKTSAPLNDSVMIDGSVSIDDSVPLDNSGSPAPRHAASGRRHSPTRETLLRLLENADEPQTVSKLAESTGWHPNTVRGHLTALWNDGYLDRQLDSEQTPGRPSWQWSATRRPANEPYTALATVLAAALAQSNDPAAAAREAGRAWGRQLGEELPRAHSTSEARNMLVEVMRDQGFAPAASADDGEQARSTPEIVLHQCPFIEAVSGHQDVVCSVHLGMALGVIESVGAEDGGTQIAPFIAPGTCALRLRLDGTR